MKISIFDYFQVTGAGLSIVSCLITFWVGYNIKGFNIKPRNIFLAFQQLAHLMIALAFVVEFINDKLEVVERTETRKNLADLTKVLMSTGLSSSIFWFSFMSFYYFLRYYLKFYKIPKYLILVLIASLVAPLVGFVFNEYLNDLEVCDNCFWDRHQEIFLLLSVFVIITLALQLAFSSLLIVIYKKSGNRSSLFKKRFCFWDIGLVVVIYGALVTVSFLEYFDIELTYFQYGRPIALIVLSLIGLARFLLSECIVSIKIEIDEKRFEKSIYVPLLNN